MVIVATVTLYGLTAAPVARRLRVTRPARTRPLLVGDHPWVVDLGRSLQSLGLEVLMWGGREDQQERIRTAGLELAPEDLLTAASGGGAELEGVTAVLLLTDEDDFNALATRILSGGLEGRVYRLGPSTHARGVVASVAGGETLFGAGLSRPEVVHRYGDGARVITRRADGGVPAGHDLLFLVRSDGRLLPVTAAGRPEARPGDVAVLLG